MLSKSRASIRGEISDRAGGLQTYSLLVQLLLLSRHRTQNFLISHEKHFQQKYVPYLDIPSTHCTWYSAGAKSNTTVYLTKPI